MSDDPNGTGRERPANDNRPPNQQGVSDEADTFRRLDAVVLTIARLIGRRMAREDYEQAMRAANDNAPPTCDDKGQSSDDGE